MNGRTKSDAHYPSTLPGKATGLSERLAVKATLMLRRRNCPNGGSVHDVSDEL
jgi:hypothetical protein